MVVLPYFRDDAAEREAPADPLRIAASPRIAGGIRELVLTPSVYEALERLMRARDPWETVCLLYGAVDDRVMEIATCTPLENATPARRRFRVLRAAFEAIVERHGPPDAIYHSHARTLLPSRLDLRSIRSSSLPWVIGARATGSAGSRALRLAVYQAAGERVHVVPHLIRSPDSRRR